MTSRPPSELVSLLHHVELREILWWDAAIEKTILSVFLADDRPKSLADLRRELQAYFREDLDLGHVGRLLRNLIDTDQILMVDANRYKLDEDTRDLLLRHVEEHASLEHRIRERFRRILQSAIPELDCASTFSAFMERFLEPLVSDLGAETWRLLMAERFSFDDIRTPLPRFLKLYPDEFHEALRQVLIAFFDPGESDVRRFVLRLMSAYFFTEARTLSGQDLHRIAKQLQSLHLSLVMDSPLLLGLVAARSLARPASPGATALITLAEDYLHIRPCAAGLSVGEVQSEVRAVVESRRRGVSSRPSRDSERCQIEIGAWVAAVGPRDPDGWLERTAHKFAILARGQGVEVLDFPTIDELLSARNVAGDLRLVTPGRGTSAPESKTVDEWFHDVLLWHFVADKRAPAANILEADYWLLTDDPELLAFDRMKAEGASQQPICMHPVAVLQLLPFVGSQDEAWEEAFFAAVRAPLLVRTSMDSATEGAALRVLDSLEWHSQLDDVTTSIVADEHMNSILQQRFTHVGSAHAAIEAAREQLRTNQAGYESALEDAEARVIAESGASPEAVRSVFMDLRGAMLAVNTAAQGVAAIELVTANDAALVRDLLVALREDIASLRRSGSATEGVVAVAEALDAEGARPRSDVVKQALSSLRSISEGVAGNVVFTQAGPILEQLHHLL